MFDARVSECETFLDFQNSLAEDATIEDYNDFNVTHLSTTCKINGKR